MIIGAHVMLQSRNPSADKAFFGGVLNLPSVDAGGGFLIFGVPPAEVAIHDSDRNDVHQLYLMCEDAGRFVKEMQRLGIACTEPAQQRWGTLFEITLPRRSENLRRRAKRSRRERRRGAKRRHGVDRYNATTLSFFLPRVATAERGRWCEAPEGQLMARFNYPLPGYAGPPPRLRTGEEKLGCPRYCCAAVSIASMVPVRSVRWMASPFGVRVICSR
jgi:hypothetical protein